MNSAPATQDKTWTRRKFWTVLTVVFVLQLAWLFIFGRPDPTPLNELPRRTSFRMLARNLPAGAFDTLLVPDPTLFVLPSRDSFSGAAWLNLKEMDYLPTEWTEPPRWLLLQPEKLIKTFNQFVQANKNPLMQISGKMAPYEPAPALPVVPATAKSRFRVEGELTSRLASDLPALSPWQSNEPLDRTVVEIGVNEAGHVVSVRLIQKSGLVSADQAALRMARTLRFSPDPAVNLMLGRANFLWHTEPLGATNSAPVTSELR